MLNQEHLHNPHIGNSGKAGINQSALPPQKNEIKSKGDIMTETANQLKKLMENLFESTAQKKTTENVGQDNAGSDDYMSTLIHINSLVKSGLLPAEQAKGILYAVINKELGITGSNPAQSSATQTANWQPQVPQQPAAAAEAGKYSEIFDYLKGVNSQLDQDDYNNLSQIIDNIAQNAVDKQLQQMEHEKKLSSGNSNAKSRLTANAQNTGYESKKDRIFTREEIGRMSTKEFLENEDAIMYQLRNKMI